MTPTDELLNRAAQRLEQRGGRDAYSALLDVSQGGESIAEALEAVILHLGLPYDPTRRLRGPVLRWCLAEDRTQTEVLGALRGAALSIKKARMRDPYEIINGWWWLSFADDTGFLGVAVLHAESFDAALRKSGATGLNPGGSVQGVPLPEEYVPAEPYRNRLLNAAEAISAGGIKVSA
ncbi:hypothetical protein Ccr2_gp299 [Caulobacter phage Ccr2]|nr:hypothetical protein Ccr10_gp300 [Caulobacter phage Ccr10]ARB14175.1 hypothetical protein Ccr2_gp299 [Caulobacter phage Ccr2]ARB14869.1 hypothetical protein Ccr29_gp313 [Caulobacter phage Ccr29]